MNNEMIEVLNVVVFLVVCSSFSYVVAMDRTDCKVNCPLGLILVFCICSILNLNLNLNIP